MELSTLSRYGMRAMVRLATLQTGGQPVISLREIAKAENISFKYLEAIFSLLKKHKLVLSHKGKNGGYMLNKPAKEITALEIVEALEGTISPVGCLNNKLDCSFGQKRCKVVNLWADLDETIREKLNSTTVADLSMNLHANK